MKIAIISSGFLPVVDGVTVTVWNRLQKLSEWGHEVLLFCPDYSSIEEVYPRWQDFTGNILPGVNVVSLTSTPFMDLDFERNVSRQSYKTCLQKLQEFQPDLIHVDEPERLFAGFLKVPGVDFAKRSRIPCVSFFHTNFLEYGEDYFALPKVIDIGLKAVTQTLFSWIYNSYNATLVSGAATEEKVAKIGIKNSVKGDFLGVDTVKFHPNLRKAQFFEQNYGLAEVDQKVKVIFLGRLTPDKGWAFTLEAMLSLAQAIDPSNLALLVAGDGPLQDEIVEKLGKVAQVHCFGRVDPDQVPALLANSDIHVTASEKETKGLTVLEAFAAGIPVVAPRAGGLIDSVQDGVNGFLFNPGDRQDFINKLKLLVEDAALRQTMGANGRAFAVQNTSDRAVENLLKVWQAQIAKTA